MAFALLIIGITLIVAAVRDTQNTLITLLVGDFSGKANFLYWIAALLMVGSIGYIPRAKPISDGLLVVILLALFLSRGDPEAPAGGFFKQFTDALAGTTTATPATASAGGNGLPNLGVNIPGVGGVNLGSSGRITNPREWQKMPNGEIWTPTGN